MRSRAARAAVEGASASATRATRAALATLAAVAAALLLLPHLAPAAASPDSQTAPALGLPVGYVTDAAGVLAPEDRATLEQYLGEVERRLDVQFAVVVVPTTAPDEIEDYAVRLFQGWGIGARKKDTGLLLIAAIKDRKVRFEVGYGLESVLPDGRVGGIIRSEIAPRFRSGDYAGGLLAGVAAAARYVAEEKGVEAPVPSGGVPAPSEEPQTGIPGAGRALLRILPLVVLAIVFLAITGARRRPGGRGRGRGGGLGNLLLWSLLLNPPGGRGGWRGGGFGGFGGFGGGASGGGFGGFGGGASGGGGATGSW